jgi:beta-glucosidase
MQQAANSLYGKVPVISMTMSPGVILMPWADKVDAAMNIFLAGKYTGTAFADALFGDINPSAKLPVTFPMSIEDTIPICQELPCPYEEGLWVGYQGLVKKPVRFPFGHGLSYTTFDYKMQDLVTRGCRRKFKRGSNMPEGCDGAYVCVVAKVTNKGPMPGAEVAQLYMDYPEDAGEPPMALRGFMRTRVLEPGQSQTVTFPIHERDVQIWDTDADGWASPDGAFKVIVGSSSRDLRLDSKFQMCNGKSSKKVRTCRKAHQ